MSCCIEGCDREEYSKGMCSVHYNRAREGRNMAAPVRQVLRGLSDADRIRAKVLVTESGCWEWQASRTPLGYGQMRFQGTRELAHRASWVVFKGPIPADESAYGTLGVLHRCDNPPCVNPDHLFLGDQSSNTLDSISKNRWNPDARRGCKGEAHGRAVVTEDIVREIRASTETPLQCAARYGLSIGAVRHILGRRSWRHVT